MESGAGVVSARRARVWRSRSSSSIFRCYGTGLHGRRLKAREKGSRPRSGSSWTLAGAAEAASAGTAVETAVLEHSARARARRHMARDSCGAEPCRPDGNGGQSCGEQSRQQQTFGKHSTDENHSWFLSCAILVSLCRLGTGRQVDQQRWAALRNEGATAGDHKGTNPAAGFWAGCVGVSPRRHERREGSFSRRGQHRTEAG